MWSTGCRELISNTGGENLLFRFFLVASWIHRKCCMTWVYKRTGHWDDWYVFFPVDLWILKGRVSHWSGTILKVSVAFIPFNLLRRVPFQPPTSGPFGHGSPESAKTWAAALTWWSSWWSYARPYERGRHRNLWHWKRRSTLRTRHWGFYTRMIVMMAVVLFKKS